jgi:short-subunit dehydrogenase
VRRITVVTGASAGVGRATVRELARRGHSLALIARGDEGLKAAAREVDRAGRPVVILPTDVADPEQVEASAEETERHLGPIDVWVNNAMTSVFAPFWDIRPEEFRRVSEVTYLGVVNGTRAALRRMRPRGRGVIVQVGSALAYRSIPLQAAYCAAKHAVVGFTDSLRSELIHDGSGVRVSVVHLPALNTPQFDWLRNKLPHRAQPVPPIYQPEYAARAIVHAIDHPTRETLLGAPTVLAVQGHKVAPGLLDRYLAATAYGAQQEAEPEKPGRADNLFTPIDRDLGAHGRFDARAREATVEGPLAASGRVAAIAGAGVAAALLALRARRSS